MINKKNMFAPVYSSFTDMIWSLTVSVLVTFHLMYLHIVLILSRSLNAHLLKKSCALVDPMFSLYNVYFTRFGLWAGFRF